MGKKQKNYLNYECAVIAKKELDVSDIQALSEATGKPQSHIVEVIAGRRKTDGVVIDFIQKRCVQKLKDSVKLMQSI